MCRDVQTGKHSNTTEELRGAPSRKCNLSIPWFELDCQENQDQQVLSYLFFKIHVPNVLRVLGNYCKTIFLLQT